MRSIFAMARFGVIELLSTQITHSAQACIGASVRTITTTDSGQGRAIDATSPLRRSRRGVDLLYHAGRDLTARPLRDRRAGLEEIAAGSELVFPVCRLAPDGPVGVAAGGERGYEGYVAKAPASAYEGGATRPWLKVKQKDWTIGDERWTPADQRHGGRCGRRRLNMANSVAARAEPRKSVGGPARLRA
jgi:hypothetical protein